MRQRGPCRHTGKEAPERRHLLLLLLLLCLSLRCLVAAVSVCLLSACVSKSASSWVSFYISFPSLLLH